MHSQGFDTSSFNLDGGCSTYCNGVDHYDDISNHKIVDRVGVGVAVAVNVGGIGIGTVVSGSGAGVIVNGVI